MHRMVVKQQKRPKYGRLLSAGGALRCYRLKIA
jgi:hypothetical protein